MKLQVSHVLLVFMGATTCLAATMGTGKACSHSAINMLAKTHASSDPAHAERSVQSQTSVCKAGGEADKKMWLNKCALQHVWRLRGGCPEQKDDQVGMR